VLVMRHGEKVEEGNVAEIFDAPRHPYTRALLAAVPRLGALAGEDLPRRFPQLRAEGDHRDAASFDQYPPQNTVRPGAPILEVRNLTTRFDIRRGLLSRVTGRVHAVEQVNFSLLPGETLALVGESGCGKSTTGRTVMMLQEATAGEVRFQGQDILAMSGAEKQAMRRKIQYVFQDPFASLDPRLTVGFSIAEPILTHKLASGREVDERVAQLLRDVGLKPEHAQRYPYEFSGGQRQRVCIARALAGAPEVMITDEAVAALDVSIQAQVLNLLLDLRDRHKLTILFIAHDLSVVEYLCDQIAVMYLGRLAEIGPARPLYAHPAHPYTEALLSAIPQPDPTLKRMRTILAGDIPSPLAPPSGCVFRTRCPRARDICAEGSPDPVAMGPAHQSYCKRTEELYAAT
ncbi:dipeptide ABC transporter ATP-binding protein, partial [Thioclava sp. BHET1]